jgi:glucose-inhibited division protein A
MDKIKKRFSKEKKKSKKSEKEEAEKKPDRTTGEESEDGDYNQVFKKDYDDAEKKTMNAVPIEEQEKSLEKWSIISKHIDRLKKDKITPTDENKKIFKEMHGQELYKEVTKAELAKRPENNVVFLEAIDDEFRAQSSEVKKQVFIHIKYEGYVDRQMSQIREYERSESFKIPSEIDYKMIKGLKKESAIKLDKLRPESIGQASRIAGVNPADIVVLLAYLETRKKRRLSSVSRETLEH